MALAAKAKAGACIFAGTAQFGILLILAEVYYPGYSASSNYISDLGAFCPGGGSPCQVFSPSSLIFDLSVALLGLLVIACAVYLQKAFHYAPTTAIVAIAGAGAIGVGVFPETTGVVHGFFSLVVFLFAGLGAVTTARFQKAPFSVFSVVLGLVTLAALVLYVGGSYLSLGPGGMERMVTYPVLLWGVGFGGYMMGQT
jgi:hypothetical membrane protein